MYKFGWVYSTPFLNRDRGIMKKGVYHIYLGKLLGGGGVKPPQPPGFAVPVKRME